MPHLVKKIQTSAPISTFQKRSKIWFWFWGEVVVRYPNCFEVRRLTKAFVLNQRLYYCLENATA